jgi:hypothetical protein
MACVVRAGVVVLFDVLGHRLAVSWDGGPRANVHAMRGGCLAEVLEVWHMGGTPVPCTPHALSDLVDYRLSIPGVMAELAEAADEVAGPADRLAFSLN